MWKLAGYLGVFHVFLGDQIQHETKVSVALQQKEVVLNPSETTENDDAHSCSQKKGCTFLFELEHN